jgi:hypothetical protein
VNFGKFASGFAPTFFKLALIFFAIVFVILKPQNELSVIAGLVFLGILAYSVYQGYKASLK